MKRSDKAEAVWDHTDAIKIALLNLASNIWKKPIGLWKRVGEQPKPPIHHYPPGIARTQEKSKR